jgi:UDP-N-acetylmuramate--alanine ligase
VKVLNTVDAWCWPKSTPPASADRRRRRPCPGARLARGRKDRAGVRRNIADVPGAILDVARDGDVVITMGAGSIGGVPGQTGGGD